MPTNLSPEQNCFIVIGVLIFFIGMPLSLICGCCKHHKRHNEYIIINP